MKIPTEFAPQSWEMSPGFVVLEESASVVSRDFDGEKLDWLVALVQIPALDDAILWARPLSARFDAGFIACGNHMNPVTPVPFTTKIYKRSELRPSLFAEFLEKNLFARYFALNNQCQLRVESEAVHESVLLLPKGNATWFLGAVSQVKDEATPFKWNTPLPEFEFLRLSALEVWKQIQESLADSKSDAFFSRRFALLNDEDRHNLVFNRDFSAGHEFCEWLFLRLKMQDAWEEVPQGGQIHFSVERYNRGFDNYLRWKDGSSFTRLTISDSLNTDVEQLRKWFLPLNENVAVFSCVEKWLMKFYPSLLVKVSRPTAHEQLEAALRWREWKAKHEKL